MGVGHAVDGCRLGGIVAWRRLTRIVACRGLTRVVGGGRLTRVVGDTSRVLHPLLLKGRERLRVELPLLLEEGRLLLAALSGRGLGHAPRRMRNDGGRKSRHRGGGVLARRHGFRRRVGRHRLAFQRRIVAVLLLPALFSVCSSLCPRRLEHHRELLGPDLQSRDHKSLGVLCGRSGISNNVLPRSKQNRDKVKTHSARPRG